MLLTTDSIDEFTRLAGLDLNAAQVADLREMLRLNDTGTWRWPNWPITNPRLSIDVIAARALIGLLVLDENVLWTAYGRPALRDAFRRLETSVTQLDAAAVKIRRANGEESIERLNTGKRIRFVCTRYGGSARGCICDLLIVTDGSKWTEQVRTDLLPMMATGPNPQIIEV